MALQMVGVSHWLKRSRSAVVMAESVMVELLCGAGGGAGGSDGVGDGGGPSKNVRPPFGGLTVCHELFDA